jgi:hypothetical protein
VNDARTWFAQKQTQLARVPALEDALLGSAPLGYALYRLKYVGIRALLRTLFRLLELALFASTFSFSVLGPILLVRSAMLVGEALWWGALETLRRDVRTMHRSGQSPVRVIRQWLALACCLAALVLFASVLYIPFGPSPFHGFDVIDVFVLGCGLRWALDLVTRTYHSGVYGVRRVYRPGWSLLLIDVADVVALVSAYLVLGAWGLGLSLALMGVLRACLSYLFVRRTYGELRIAVGGLPSWFRGFRNARWSIRHSLASALGNAVAQVDAFLVLGLLAAPADARGSLMVAALFHGIAPLHTAAFSWSRLFYFDFKRLEGWGSPFLLERFEAFLGRVALWVPVPITLVTWLLLALFWNGSYWLLALELSALAAVRARLSLVHIRAYSLSDHTFLSKLFAGMLVVVLVTPVLGTLPANVSVGAVALLAGLGLLVLGRSRRALAENSLAPIVGLGVWLARLLEQGESVRVGLIAVDRRLSSLGRLVRALEPALVGASLTRLGRDAFVWFAPAKQSLNVERLVVLGAGAIRENRIAEPAASGLVALEAGAGGALWQRHVGRYLDRYFDVDVGEAIDADWVRQKLRQIAPTARCIDLSEMRIAAPLEGCPVRPLRRLIATAARARPEFLRVGSAEAAVLAPAGRPTMLVVVPPGPENSATWRAEVTSVLRHAEVFMTLAMCGVAPPSAPSTAENGTTRLVGQRGEGTSPE